MEPSDLPSPAIVVGIDGSRNAVNAALWAVDEAVSRDIPLRLVYAIEPTDRSPDAAARELAAADIAVRTAFMAVESTGEPVKIEVEIAQKFAVEALRDQSRSAAMLCLGALGWRRAAGRRVGSVAAAIAETAHCPVAVIRKHDLAVQTPRWVVAFIDESPDSPDVLDLAVDEALLRHAPLRVVTTWSPCFADMSDDHAVADNNRQIRAHQERMLARYRRLHPDLDAHPVAVRGHIENYVARHADSIGLIIIGHRRSPGVAKLFGLSQSTLQEAHCSIVICPVSSAL